LTVEVTVKPLKSGEKVETSEHTKNTTRRLKRLGRSIGQAGKRSKKRAVAPYGRLYICRGIALGLRGKGNEGLEEVKRALSLSAEEWEKPGQMSLDSGGQDLLE
jgi:hypothetical protein